MDVVDRSALIGDGLDLLGHPLRALPSGIGYSEGFGLERGLVAHPALAEAGKETILDNLTHRGVQVVEGVHFVLESSLQDHRSQAGHGVVVGEAATHLHHRSAIVGGRGEGFDVRPEDIEAGPLVGGTVAFARRPGLVDVGDALSTLRPSLRIAIKRLDASMPSVDERLVILFLSGCHLDPRHWLKAFIGFPQRIHGECWLYLNWG